MLIDRGTASPLAGKGSVAVVTGAGQGIGRETARILAHLGAAVVLAELNDSGRETERLIGADGGRAAFVQTDVGDPTSMARLYEQTLRAFGEADILVNNACAFAVKPLLEQTVEEWDRVMAVNLRGAFLGLKLFLPGMLRRRSGVYVTMQSSEGMPYLAPYFASKVGLRSLALSLAAELGEQSGVWSYCFGAGLVDTPGGNQGFRAMAGHYGLSLEEFIRQSAPAGKPISAELSATGLVGTILHGQRFHGQETDYIAGLAQLGLDPWGEPISTEPAVLLAERDAPGARRDNGRSRYAQAAVLNRRMEDVVRANLREYDSLSMFQRPVIKRMFRQGTGLNVEEWLLRAETTTQRLEAAEHGAGALGSEELRTYLAQVGRMAEWIDKQQDMLRGWEKDPQKLDLGLTTLRERKAVADQLARKLRELLDEPSGV